MASRDIVLLPLVSRAAATYNTADQSTSFAKGVVLFLNITVITGTLDAKIQVKDPISLEYIDMASAAFAQRTQTGKTMLTIYPGIAETANVSVSDRLPKVWRVSCVVATGPITFSLAAEAVD